MRQLVVPFNTFAGGHLGEGGGGGGTYEALIEAGLLWFTIRQPHRELSGSVERNTCQGMGAYPLIPTLSTRSACRPA